MPRFNKCTEVDVLLTLHEKLEYLKSLLLVHIATVFTRFLFFRVDRKFLRETTNDV